MKAKYMFMAFSAILVMPVAAQETYENAKVITEDLNGTARYVGMGGATDALGADISTISTNPAGIGLFRHNKVEATAGMVTQQDAAKYSGGDATNLSFDQIGVVLTTKGSNGSFLNFAFNFHKSKNFDYILSADSKLNNASQNKLSYMKLYNGLLYAQGEDGTFYEKEPFVTCNQLDDIYFRNLFYAAGDGLAYYYDAEGYDFDRAHSGYVGEYDFNISGNIHDRVYLGFTLGLHDVHYLHKGDYTETMMPNPEDIKTLNVYDERRIKGTGVSLKFGAPVRPIEYSPLLIGVNISSPVYYDLKSSNYTEVSDGNYTAYAEEAYEYKVYTPWKFGVNLGYTVGNYLALGASYEFSDFSRTDARVNEGDRYYYDYHDTSNSDEYMNRNTKNTLKGVSTIKVGAEFKPMPEMAIRAGYNYVSPMYEKDGFKDGTIPSYGTYYASATDYTNWESTNRLTFGMGWRWGQVNLDLAYQYSMTSGKFTPFMNYRDSEYEDFDIITNEVKVNNKRHQILCTLGYTF